MKLKNQQQSSGAGGHHHNHHHHNHHHNHTHHHHNPTMHHQIQMTRSPANVGGGAMLSQNTGNMNSQALVHQQPNPPPNSPLVFAPCANDFGSFEQQHGSVSPSFQHLNSSTVLTRAAAVRQKQQQQQQQLLSQSKSSANNPPTVASTQKQRSSGTSGLYWMGHVNRFRFFLNFS